MGKTGSCPDEQGLIQCNFNPIICWWMWHYIPFLVVFWPKANFNPQIPWGFLRWESEFLFLELNFQIEHANIHCCMQANRIYIKEKKVQSSQHRHSVSSVQLFSHVRFCNIIECSTLDSLSITNFWSLLKLISLESVTPSNHLILCHPLLLLPSIFPSIRVFSKESILHIRWPKCWSFSFSIHPSNEYSWLICFRIDRFDLLT